MLFYQGSQGEVQKERFRLFYQASRERFGRRSLGCSSGRDRRGSGCSSRRVRRGSCCFTRGVRRGSQGKV